MATFTAEVEEVRRFKAISEIVITLVVQDPTPAKGVRIFIRDDSASAGVYTIGRQFSIVVTPL